MHIRYNEALLKYEYTNTNVDTGPWTTLPLANNVGGALANVAYTNVSNNFTVSQYFTAGEGIYIHSASNYARLHMRDFSRPAGSQTFVLLNYTDKLYICPTGDDGLYFAGGTGWDSGLTISRVGVIQSGAQYYPGRVDIATPAPQLNWYIAGHASYGLYTNTGLYAVGSYWTANNVNAGGYLYALNRTALEYEGGWSLWAITAGYFWADGGPVSASSIDYCYFFVGRTCFVNITVTINVTAPSTYIYCYLPVTSARRCNGMGVCLPGTSRIPFHAYSTSNQLVWQRATIHPYDINHWPAGVWLFALQMAIQF